MSDRVPRLRTADYETPLTREVGTLARGRLVCWSLLPEALTGAFRGQLTVRRSKRLGHKTTGGTFVCVIWHHASVLRSCVMRQGVALVMATLLVAACSSGDVDSSPTWPTATATAAPDISEETRQARDDAATTSEAATSASSADNVTTSAEKTDEVDEATSDEAAPRVTETDEEPPQPSPEPDPCSGDSLSNDLLGYAGAVGVLKCEQGWAYAYYQGGEGDTEFIAQRQSGTWVQIATLGSPMCQEEFWEMGAPPAVTIDVLPCDVMYPPEGADPLLPDTDCVIPTEQFGATYATLIGISCDDAASRWYAAADNYPPSFDTPIVLDGWECWVYPNDPSSWVAGSCAALDGSASVILNVP